MDKEKIRRVTDRIRDLLASQKLAVLSTHNNGAPYASLVAYIADDSLEFLLFATPRTTRKFASLSAEPRAALLVNNSRNETEDFHKAAAVTVTVPLVILVLVFQQKIVAGLTAGAVKG